MADSEQDAINAMAQFGGSFVKRLAECWRYADIENRARLRVAFADLIDEYRELARLKVQRELGHD